MIICATMIGICSGPKLIGFCPRRSAVSDTQRPGACKVANQLWLPCRIGKTFEINKMMSIKEVKIADGTTSKII